MRQYINHKGLFYNSSKISIFHDTWENFLQGFSPYHMRLKFVRSCFPRDLQSLELEVIVIFLPGEHYSKILLPGEHYSEIFLPGEHRGRRGQAHAPCHPPSLSGNQLKKKRNIEKKPTRKKG